MIVASLHYSNTIIDLSKTFGMQVMELGELHELSSKGVDARLYAKDIKGSHPKIKKITYTDYDRNLYDIPYYAKFIEQTNDADILQGNGTPLLAAFRPERTIIRFDGAIDIPLTNNKIIAKAYEKVHYIFVSTFLKSFFEKRYPFISGERSHVLHNAVKDVGVKNKKNHRKKILFCSRWIADKGVNVLIDALEMVKKKKENFDVIIAGGIQTVSKKGINEQNRLELAIQNKFEQMGNVEVVGFMPHDNLIDFVKTVDFVLFPSLYNEPFGLIPAEAAMAGVPTIAFGVGGVPEVIEHNHTGIVLKKSKWNMVNSKRLANAILMLLNNEKEVERLGKNARELCLERFGWGSYVEKLIGIYNQVANTKFL